MRSDHQLILELDPTYLPVFNTLLALGFEVDALSGTRVGELLQNALGIGPDFIEDEIQTVFVNGKATDDVEGHCLYEPATIALSAAMPGVFGAAFRKKGHFAAMRQSVSCTAAPAGDTSQPITVTVKCFNKVAEKLAPGLLNQGVRISSTAFLRFWQHHRQPGERECRAIRVDGVDMASERLPRFLEGLNGAPVQLVITTA